MNQFSDYLQNEELDIHEIDFLTFVPSCPRSPTGPGRPTGP